jgi:hypothetical protein
VNADEADAEEAFRTLEAAYSGFLPLVKILFLEKYIRMNRQKVSKVEHQRSRGVNVEDKGDRRMEEERQKRNLRVICP